MEKIVVVESLQGKYGPQIKLVDGTYLSFGKFFKGDTELVPGAYDAVIYWTAKGNGYLNSAKLLESAEVPKTVEPPKETAKSKKEFKAKEDTSMSKAEWQAKDRSQLIGGLSHDAATLVGALIGVIGDFANTDEVVKAHKQVLEGLLKNRDEVK